MWEGTLPLTSGSLDDPSVDGSDATLATTVGNLTPTDAAEVASFGSGTKRSAGHRGRDMDFEKAATLAGTGGGGVAVVPDSLGAEATPPVGKATPPVGKAALRSMRLIVSVCESQQGSDVRVGSLRLK